MKKSTYLFILITFLALCLNVFAADASAFHVKVSGKGERAIIFIPGFASSSDVWKETLPLFENKFKCFALTMPGFAGVPASENVSFNDWEKSIADYLKEQQIANAIIIGHSMGGGLALALAADYPELISKIVVVDALPCLAALNNPSFKSEEKPDCNAAITSMTSMNNEQFHQMQQSTMPRLMTDTTHLDEAIEWSVKSDRKTFAQMFCDFSNTDLRTRISTIKCPALILLESVFVSMDKPIKEQYKNLKTAKFAYATKGLHFIMYDDKEWYNNQLTSFVNN